VSNFSAFVIALALLASGCETTQLWVEPQESYVKVIPQSPDEDVEPALKNSGREYHCKQLYYSSHANNKICYAKVTSEEKLDSIGVKLLKTPEKLVIDAGRTILVIGYVALAMKGHISTGTFDANPLIKRCRQEKCD